MRVIRATHKRRKTDLKQNSKKKVKHEDKWLDNAAKKARAEGVAGKGRNGPIEARELKEGCSKACRFRCSEKITELDRELAHADFYGLENTTKKWECISNWVSVTERVPDQESIEIAEIRDKKLTIKNLFEYTLPSSTGPVSVCRTMFLSTLSMYYVILLL